jgi:hypothetical protein
MNQITNGPEKPERNLISYLTGSKKATESVNENEYVATPINPNELNPNVIKSAKYYSVKDSKDIDKKYYTVSVSDEQQTKQTLNNYGGKKSKKNNKKIRSTRKMKKSNKKSKMNRGGKQQQQEQQQQQQQQQ